MRSIILGIGVALVSATAPAATPWLDTPRDARCPNDPSAHLARPGQDAEFRRLTDLPPADAYRAVFRRGADGCIEHVKLERAPRREQGSRPRR